MRQLQSIWSRTRTFVTLKLGRCERCMRVAALGAATAWAAAAAGLIFAPVLVAGLALGAAALFSALVRVAKDEPACADCRQHDAEANASVISRRAFFGATVTAVGALVYVVAQRASIAEALGKCKPNFRVGSISGGAQIECDFTHTVDVTCDCTGTCDKDAQGHRPPCERDNTSPLTYAWTLTTQQGAAAISGAATNSNVVVNVTTAPAKYTLQVTVGGCKCCCRGTADCKTAPAAPSKAKQFSVASC